MAFINIAEWTAHHVVQWVQGLDDCLLPYAHFFLEHQINGCRLLMLLPEDLEKLNIIKIGHQELILDAIDQLRHLHYSFTTETLQTLALRLGCKSRSLYNLMRKEVDCGQCSSCLYNQKHEEEQRLLAESSMANGLYSPSNSSHSHHNHHSNHNYYHHSSYGGHASGADRLDRLEPIFIQRACRKISTNTLSGVCDILLSVKQFVSWIDKDPFDGQDYYIPIRKTILAISIELASTAQRDHFVESPKEIIKSNCLTFAEICDRIVQELSDSLAIQPAVLEMVPIKKRPDEEFGMNIISSYSGVHTIAKIKIQSPTHRCGRVEESDEIAQINYQTVIGWQFVKLMEAIQEYPNEVLLTIKKRPRHSTIIGQLDTFKTFKIPQRKIFSAGTVSGSLFRENTCDLSKRTQKALSTTSSSTQNPMPLTDNDKQRLTVNGQTNSTGVNNETILIEEKPVNKELIIKADLMKPVVNMEVSGNENQDTNNVYDQAESGDNKQLIEKVSLEKPMTGPVYQLLAKPKRLRRRATISGSSPTTICPPIRIEDLVSLDQKQSKRLANSRKSADPRLVAERRSDLLFSFSSDTQRMQADHRDLERRMERLSRSPRTEEHDFEQTHPDVLKRRKEIIARTYSDEVSGSMRFQNKRFELNDDLEHTVEPIAEQLKINSVRGQVTCTIVDVGAGKQASSRTINLNDQNIINRLLANRSKSPGPADRFSTEWLMKRAEANGWIDFWQSTYDHDSDLVSEHDLMLSEQGRTLFYVLDLNLLYLFTDEHKSRPEKLIDLNRIDYLSEMFYMATDRWWFEMRDDHVRYLISSKVEALLRSLLTRLKGLYRHRSTAIESNHRLEDDPNEMGAMNAKTKSKKCLTKNKSKFYLNDSLMTNDCNRSAITEVYSNDTVLQLKPVPTPKPRLSKINIIGCNDSTATKSTSSLDHYPSSSIKQSTEANTLIGPPKPARAHEEATFYAPSLTGHLLRSNWPISSTESPIKCATSDEIQLIYTQRHLHPMPNDSKTGMTISHSPTSDTNSQSSSSGISSYYSSIGTTQINSSTSHTLPTTTSHSHSMAPSLSGNELHIRQVGASSLNTSGSSSIQNESFVSYVDSINRTGQASLSHLSPQSLNSNGDESLSQNDSLLSNASRSPQRKSSFRLFGYGSPKMLRKFTSSSKMSKDKSHDLKDAKKIEASASGKTGKSASLSFTSMATSGASTSSSYNHGTTQPSLSSSSSSCQEPKGSGKSKLFLNSPRFTRALFGSKRASSKANANVLVPEKCSTACQTDESLLPLNRSSSETSIQNSYADRPLHTPDALLNECKSTLPNRNCSDSTDSNSQTIAAFQSLPHQSASFCAIDVPSTPDAGRKPTMGISMLSKRRTSSVGTDRATIESALSIHHSQCQASLESRFSNASFSSSSSPPSSFSYATKNR